MVIHRAFISIREHTPQHDPQWQTDQTSKQPTWPLAASWATDINMVSGSSTGHDNMASSGNMNHQHGLQRHTDHEGLSRRSNPENDLLSTSDILSLLRVSMQQSLLHTILQVLFGNDMLPDQQAHSHTCLHLFSAHMPIHSAMCPTSLSHICSPTLPKQLHMQILSATSHWFGSRFLVNYH